MDFAVSLHFDLREKTDDFVRSGLGFKDIVTSYYFGFIPHIIALLLPLFVFLAVGRERERAREHLLSLSLSLSI